MFEKYMVLFKQNYVLVAFTFLLSYAYCRFTASDDPEDADSAWMLVSASLVSLGVFFVIYIHGLSDGEFEEIIHGDAKF